MKDTVNLAARQAARNFGSREIFNSAGFGQALCRIAGLETKTLDGHLVETILHGRDDIRQLSGGCHWCIGNKGEK